MYSYWNFQPDTDQGKKGFFLHVVSAISKLDAFRVGDKFKLRLVMPPKTTRGSPKELNHCVTANGLILHFEVIYFVISNEFF